MRESRAQSSNFCVCQSTICHQTWPPPRMKKKKKEKKKKKKYFNTMRDPNLLQKVKTKANTNQKSSSSRFIQVRQNSTVPCGMPDRIDENENRTRCAERLRPRAPYFILARTSTFFGFSRRGNQKPPLGS